MKSKLWQKAVEVYQAALKQEPSRRGAFLHEACVGDEELLREVLSLLSGVAPVPGSLDSPGPEAVSPEGGHAGDSLTARRGDSPLPRPSFSDIGPELGRYSILSPIGAGGMGEVFRARDRSLGREVAIKVMHQGFASSPNLLRRFEREARAAAALNHPNIATVYEVGDHGGHRFIAMELVDGRTLREMLQGKPLPTGEVVRLATQIAGGLAKAHAAGIVHRDLKPGNLMVTTDGFAKILDFGLVKRLPHTSEDDSEITGEGAVVGTVEYMAPEQAQAEEIDHRTDQFSLGVILYEMATGRRPFRREVPAQTLVAIIRDEPPPVTEVNPEVPAGLARIIRRCMAKKPGDRYTSTADLAADLARLGASTATAPRRSPWRLGTVAAAIFAAIAAVFWLTPRPEPAAPRAAPLQVIPLTSYPGREAEPAFSPDGSQVAFSWNGASPTNRDIYVKVIGSEQALRLTSDGAQDGSPAWSPDGSRVAFLRQTSEGSEVRLVPPTGGPERLLAKVGVPPEYGLTWSPDSARLAAADRPAPGASVGLVLVDIETGAKRPLTSFGSSAGRGDSWPTFSPDGRWLAFKRSVAPTANYACVMPATGGEARQLVSTTAITSRLAWTASGEEIISPALAVVRDADSLPVPSTRSNSGAPPLLWRIPVDGGPARPLIGTSDAMDVSVSRDGHRLAYTQQTSNWDIWRVGLRGSATGASTRFIVSTRFDGNAQFSPDGQRVVFTSARSGGFEIWSADSQGQELLRLTSLGSVGSTGSPRWSPDGRSVAFDFLAEGDTGADVYVVDASGGPPRRVTRSPTPDVRPSWSRDGRFIYFGSHRSGEWQVWKVPAAGGEPGAARQVTQGGGYASIESRDGERLYFSRRRSVPEDPDNAIWEVPVDGGEEKVVIDPLRSSDTNWDVTDDGIYYVDRHESSTPREHWVINFFDFASRRVREVTALQHPPRLDGPALSVSPDGRSILISQQPPEADLMLVEDFR